MLIPCAPRGTRLFSFDSATNKPIKQIVPTYIICIDANDPKKWPRPFWAWPRLGCILLLKCGKVSAWKHVNPNRYSPFVNKRALTGHSSLRRKLRRHIVFDLYRLGMGVTSWCKPTGNIRGSSRTEEMEFGHKNLPSMPLFIEYFGNKPQVSKQVCTFPFWFQSCRKK